MDHGNDLTPSMEDYLETIRTLERKNRVARVKDIAETLSVQMPSVTGALKTLRHRGLVNYEKNSYISLTERGMDIANSIQAKHDVVQNFLRDILVLSPEESEETACKIEHVISPAAAARLKRLTRYIQNEVIGTACSDTDWLKKLRG